MPKETGTQAVDRAIAILKTFSYENPELSMMDISHQLGLHKSTVHRLIGALEREGLMSRNPGSGRYRLGLGILSLAGLVKTNEELRRIARPWLRKLAAWTEETVSLSVLDGMVSVNLERALPPGRQMVSYAWLGRRTPVHAVSTGKVLLALLPEEQWTPLLDRPLPALTPHTITDPDMLTTELEKVRKQGYAIGVEELEEGLSAVAAPVRDSNGAPIAAVAISGPTSRITKAKIPELAKLVVNVADDISSELGWVR